MAKRGKKYQEAVKLIEKESYPLSEAMELLSKTSVTKFDSSVEIHANLGVDPKQADQNIRTTTTLPHGTGKTLRIVAFVGDDKVKEAKAAGAIEAGTADLLDKIAGGWMDFDVAVAEPSQMKELGKIAKTLGQKGLMPNPKSGTVTPDPAKTIEELNKGKIEIRVDKEGNLHSIIGKVSFGADKLAENLKAFVKTVMEVKPSSQKGTYVRSLTVATSMGPGVPLDVNAAIEASK